MQLKVTHLMRQTEMSHFAILQGKFSLLTMPLFCVTLVRYENSNTKENEENFCVTFISKKLSRNIQQTSDRKKSCLRSINNPFVSTISIQFFCSYSFSLFVCPSKDISFRMKILSPAFPVPSFVISLSVLFLCIVSNKDSFNALWALKLHATFIIFH